MSTTKEAFIEMGKASPPGAIVAAHTLFGFELSEWLTILTMIYVILQIIFLVKRHVGIKQAVSKVLDDVDIGP